MSDEDIGHHTLRKITRRLLPLLFLLFLFNYLDRSNVSMAALQMNDALNFSAATFGFGAGIASLGYGMFELPSNLIMTGMGARRWIARIAVTWGVLACATMFVRTPFQFYCMRFLLGAAEAGLFPGTIYYLGKWFPGSHRARANAYFMAALSVGNVIGGPLGGALLSLNGVGHLQGWQWLFLIEGLPAIVLGFVTLRYLTEDPERADWLRPEQKAWLAVQLSKRDRRDALEQGSLLSSFRNPTVWFLVIPYFSYLTVTVGGTLWAPTLVRNALDVSSTTAGLIIGAINLLGVPVFLLTARISDRLADRCRPAALGLMLGCLGCIGVAIFRDSLPRAVSLAVIYMTTPVFLASFWCLPARVLEGKSAAAGIALIGTLGVSGGFVGPSIIGLLKQTTGDDATAFAALAGLAFIGSVACITLWRYKSEFRPIAARFDTAGQMTHLGSDP